MSTISNDSLPGADVSSRAATPRGAKHRKSAPSARKRMEDFRERKSMEVWQARRNATIARLDMDPDDLALVLKDLEIAQSKQAISTPVTTRSIGFLVNECYEQACAVVPKARQECTVEQLYRVSLAQVEVQLKEAAQHVPLESSHAKEILREEYETETWFDPIVKATPENFKVVADVVNSFGALDTHQATFFPFVPKLVEETAMDVDEVTDTGTSVKKIKVKHRVADPYTVTYSNLGETIHSLRSTANEYFENNNPVPGIQFTPGHVIDEASRVRMMEGWNSLPGLRNDCRRVRTFFAMIRSKLGHQVGRVSFDGRGSLGMLVTGYKLEMNLQNYQDQQSFFSYRPIDNSDFIKGALSLVGEYPVDGLDRRIQDYALREPIVQCSRLDVDWLGLIMRVIK